VISHQRAKEANFVMDGQAMAKKRVVFYLEVFDGPDLVYQSTAFENKTTCTCKGSDIGIIVIIVAIVIVMIIVIVVVVVVVVVLHRRNIACFSGKP
jgi:hypothetical protein